MADFVLQITDWYRLNSRDLPWRRTKNPYFIWISEIILQQTRVDQGLSYYQKFTQLFPTVHDLANASENEVLKAWQGLGYYSRARNLHFTAKFISSELNGIFPNSYNEIISLKGIGSYTAAAISSFAYNLPHAVVDGNVYRVLSRYYEIHEAIDSSLGKKVFDSLAQSLIPNSNPGEYNQAIMEFGAMQCTPSNPNCEICPLVSSCKSALQKDLIQKLPYKKGKTTVKKRYFHYFYITSNNQLALVKRTEKDVWQHLFEFPMIETVDENLPLHYKQKASFICSFKHILSHQHIHAFFYKWNPSLKPDFPYEMIGFEQLEDFPIHRLVDKFLESITN